MYPNILQNDIFYSNFNEYKFDLNDIKKLQKIYTSSTFLPIFIDQNNFLHVFQVHEDLLDYLSVGIVGIVGIVQIIRTAFLDVTDKEGRFVAVQVKFKEKFKSCMILVKLKGLQREH